MRVLICGSRYFADFHRGIVMSIMAKVPGGDHVLIHGAARGVDSLAAGCAEHLGWKIEAYPADWSKHGRAAGPIRNQLMLDSKPDLVIAIHDDPELGKGTADMVRRARAAGVQTEVWVTCLDTTSVIHHIYRSGDLGNG